MGSSETRFSLKVFTDWVQTRVEVAGFPLEVSKGEQTGRAQTRIGNRNHLSTNTLTDQATEHKRGTRLKHQAQKRETSQQILDDFLGLIYCVVR